MKEIENEHQYVNIQGLKVYFLAHKKIWYDIHL